MKTLNIVTLAAAIMAGVVSSAAAQELTLNPPDINDKLNVLVERKIDTLMEEKANVQGKADEEKEFTRAGAQLPHVRQDTFIYMVSDSRK